MLELVIDYIYYREEMKEKKNKGEGEAEEGGGEA